MAGPSERPGIQNKRFGKTGIPVKVSAKLEAASKAGKLRLYEDGTYTKKQPTTKKRAPGDVKIIGYGRGDHQPGDAPKPRAGGYKPKPTGPLPKPPKKPSPRRTGGHP